MKCLLHMFLSITFELLKSSINDGYLLAERNMSKVLITRVVLCSATPEFPRHIQSIFFSLALSIHVLTSGKCKTYDGSIGFKSVQKDPLFELKSAEQFSR